MDSFDLLLMVETYLAGRHGGLFMEVTPGRIDHCDVVLFVTWRLVGAWSEGRAFD